ncbi:AraC family transcriptional regulator [Kroppenstedtia pulmonis]|uniref:AraC family transcriptional regulator n=1 Tax=Kroppenstedtia pulmonis TaxID=1380685 RepID=A0A7D4CH91_9BACL|nr:AraC family transcriptional regulator [Kroppenstedtia pulmonis]QKG85374.1 AraC family transcriptional regulator [Kroppenstedtia pulmonis]
MRLYIVNSIRTNNFTDEQMMQKMKDMWTEASQTQNTNIIYGVYHEYESDYKGDYSLSVATEDSSDMPFIDISDTANYQIYCVDTVDEQGVIKTWKKIWGLEEEGKINRAYTYDYEKYYPNGDIEIYIAIK